MANNAQPVYNLVFAKAVAGMILSEEKCNKVSREVETAAGIPFAEPAFRGANDHGVVAAATFAATAAATADAANVGTSTITASPPAAAPAMSGQYTGIARSTSATSKVDFYRPDGTLAGVATVGTPATIDGIGPFTITNNTTTAGDRFNIAVTYTANKTFLGLTVLNPAIRTRATNPDRYSQYDTGAFMTQGIMAVPIGTGGVVPGQRVYFDTTTRLFVADATKLLIPNARFDITAGANALGAVALRERDG